jgi:hypothetical protein
MTLRENAVESRLETLLLRAIDSYESRHGTGPTVVELGPISASRPTSDTLSSWNCCAANSQPAASPTIGDSSA